MKRFIIVNKFWGNINIYVYLNAYALSVNCHQQLLSPIPAFLSAEITAIFIVTLNWEAKAFKSFVSWRQNPSVAFLSFWRSLFGFLLFFYHTQFVLFGSDYSVSLMNLFAWRNCFLIPQGFTKLAENDIHNLCVLTIWIYHTGCQGAIACWLLAF